MLQDILIRAFVLLVAVWGFAAYAAPTKYARKTPGKWGGVSDWLSGRVLYSTPERAKSYGLFVGIVASIIFVLSLFGLNAR